MRSLPNYRHPPGSMKTKLPGFWRQLFLNRHRLGINFKRLHEGNLAHNEGLVCGAPVGTPGGAKGVKPVDPVATTWNGADLLGPQLTIMPSSW